MKCIAYAKKQTYSQHSLPHESWQKINEIKLYKQNVCALCINGLALQEAADLARNRPLWRMMSAYGATQSQSCMPETTTTIGTSCLLLVNLVSFFLKTYIGRYYGDYYGDYYYYYPPFAR